MMLHGGYYFDWTYDETMRAVRDIDKDGVTLDCEHSTYEHMLLMLRWLETAGYEAQISNDRERIYVSRKE